MSSAYTETFERFVVELPESEQASRRSQFDRFQVSGFPGRELEDWRYTDLSELDERSFSLGDESGFDIASCLLPGADRLVYVNGRLNTEHSTNAQWHAATTTVGSGGNRDGVIALNSAFAMGGMALTVARNTKLAKPIQLLAISAAKDTKPTMSHQRHRIELAENAEGTVLLHFTGDGPERLATQVMDIALAPGAKLRLYRLQDDRAGGTLVTQINLRQSRDSHFETLTVDVGGGLARHDFDVDLAEAGAETEVSGFYMPGSGAHVDNHTRVVHAAPHCRSRSHYRGIIDEHAKAVFNGKVIVKPGAQKTDSEQRIANLLLSRKAEVNAKPELEIYADDVKCAHGATVGQLDQTALAYLRSRGIPRDTARALLLRAFATEILDRIEWPELRARIETSLHLPTEMPEVIEA